MQCSNLKSGSIFFTLSKNKIPVMNKARFWIGHLYPSLQWGNKMSAPDSMCDSFRGKYRSRVIYTLGSFKHLRRHCFQSWFLNYDSLSNANKANLCYERLVRVRKYVLSSSTKTTQNEPSQPGKRLLWPGLIIAARKPCVNATGWPLTWVLFCNRRIIYSYLLHFGKEKNLN